VKTVLALLLVLSATAGCVTQSMVAGSPGSAGPSFLETASDPFPPTLAGPSPDQNMMPRLVIPSTGGAPVIGIPVGGDLYLPVTGGAPIPGMPVGP
jgi:hypothetical protein